MIFWGQHLGFEAPDAVYYKSGINFPWILHVLLYELLGQHKYR